MDKSDAEKLIRRRHPESGNGLDTEGDYREIPGWLGYRAQSDGAVWTCKNNRGIHTSNWRRLKQGVTPKGYLSVTLCLDGKRKTFRSARLILLAFRGEPVGPFDACHKNDNRQDNRIDNLEWDTHANNVEQRNTRGRQAKGIGNSSARLDEYKVVEIRRLGAAGMSCRKLSAQFGIAHQNIRKILLRQTWRHIAEANNSYATTAEV